MRLEAEVAGRARTIDLERRGDTFEILLDGRPVQVDARAMEGFFTSLLVGGKAYEVTVEPDGGAWRVQIGIEAHRVAFRDPLGPRIDGGEAQDRPGEGAGPAVRTAVSMMPGKVVRILVGEGDTVAEGQGLVVIEAMKMENEVPSPVAGRVLEIKVAVQEPVEAGATLVVIGRDRSAPAP